VRSGQRSLDHAYAENGNPRALLAMRDFTARALPQVEALLTRFIESRAGSLEVPDPAMAAFLVCHAVQACVHGAVLEKPDWLRQDRFVDETTALVVGYLRSR